MNKKFIFILVAVILFQIKAKAQVLQISSSAQISGLINSQDTLYLPLDTVYKKLSLIKWSLSNIDLKEFDSIKLLPYHILNCDLSDSLKKKNGIRAAYAKLVLVNRSNKTLRVFLKCENITHIFRVFKQETNNLKLYNTTGDKVPYSLRDFPNDPERVRLDISPNKTSTFYLEVAAYHNEIKVFTPIIETYDKGLEQQLKDYDILLREFSRQFIFAGFFIAISAFSFLKAFTHQKDKAYLSYAFVNLFYAVGLTTYLNVPNLENTLMPWFRNDQQITSIANCLTAISYVFFYRNILNLKVNFKKLYLITQIYLPVNILNLTLQFFGNSPDSTILAHLLKASDICYQLFSVVLTVMIALYLRKNHLGYHKYIYRGCCSLIVGLCIYVPFSLIDKDGAKMVNGISPSIILTISLMVEVYFFLTALVFRDKIIELEKNNYQAELVIQTEANKIKTRFFSILNHDLRSPVANLIHFLHLQKEAPEMLSATDKQRLETKTLNSTENLLQSMEDLLLWSKGQMENFKPSIKNVAIKNLFDDTAKYFLGIEDVALLFENPEGVNLTTDEDYLKTIMRNLTSNAIKALSETPNAQIIWKAWQENGLSYLSITDNGPGATAEQFKALYDDKEVVGIKSGLGLHLIRDLAKAISCKISVDTNLSGTTFLLLLN